MDEIIDDAKIRLKKIDVEGAEVLALKGMTRILQRDDAPAVLCEVTAVPSERYI